MKFLEIALVAFIISVFVFVLFSPDDISEQSSADENGGSIQEELSEANQKSGKIEPINILILGSPRSGSTMLGKVFSVPLVGSAYYFEPLRFFRNVYNLNYEMFSTWNLHDASIAHGHMSSLFDCSHIISENEDENWPQQHANINEPECSQSGVKIAKTIRLHAYNMIPWILENPSVKVIQLIRDPRGIVNSKLSRTEPWDDASFENIEQICNFMEMDSRILSHLADPFRYVQVKYEDFVESPIETLEIVKKSLNLPFEVSELAHYYSHELRLSLEEMESRGISPYGYWGVVRPIDFDPNHWRGTISVENKEKIESACKQFMDNHGYK